MQTEYALHTYWNASTPDSHIKKLYMEIKRCLCYFIVSESWTHKISPESLCQRLYYFHCLVILNCTHELHKWNVSSRLCVHICIYVCVDGMEMVNMPRTKTELASTCWNTNRSLPFSIFVVFRRGSISRPKWVTILFNNPFFFFFPSVFYKMLSFGYNFKSCTRCNIIAYRLLCRIISFLKCAKFFPLEHFHFSNSKFLNFN